MTFPVATASDYVEIIALLLTIVQVLRLGFLARSQLASLLTRITFTALAHNPVAAAGLACGLPSQSRCVT